MSYVDLHLHLLPGVDDGARDEAEAVAHAARMARDGVHEALVTPHVGHPSIDLDVSTIRARTAALQAALDAEGVPLRLHAGGEIHPSAAASLEPGELSAIAAGPPGGRWVLAEVPFAGIDDAFLAGCRSIRRHGFGVVIAHPERAGGLLDDGLAALRGELRAGAVLQVNVCSLMGRHGEEALEAARRLIRAKLAYVLASDGHPPDRGHTLAAGLELAVAAGASRVHAWQLTQANPRFLLRSGMPAGPAAIPARAWRAQPEARVVAARAARRRVA